MGRPLTYANQRLLFFRLYTYNHGTLFIHARKIFTIFGIKIRETGNGRCAKFTMFSKQVFIQRSRRFAQTVHLKYPDISKLFIPHYRHHACLIFCLFMLSEMELLLAPWRWAFANCYKELLPNFLCPLSDKFAHKSIRSCALWEDGAGWYSRKMGKQIHFEKTWAQRWILTTKWQYMAEMDFGWLTVNRPLVFVSIGRRPRSQSWPARRQWNDLS